MNNHLNLQRNYALSGPQVYHQNFPYPFLHVASADLNQTYVTGIRQMNSHFEVYNELVQSIHTVMLQRIRGKSPQEAQALIQAYQEIFQVAVDTTFTGLDKTIAAISRLQKDIKRDWFAVLDKAIEVRGMLVQEHAGQSI